MKQKSMKEYKVDSSSPCLPTWLEEAGRGSELDWIHVKVSLARGRDSDIGPHQGINTII